jgi:hypothetical protein
VKNVIWALLSFYLPLKKYIEISRCVTDTVFFKRSHPPPPPKIEKNGQRMYSTWKWSWTDSWGWRWGGPEAAGSRGPNGSRGPATAAAGPPHSQARTLPGGHPSWGTRSAKCPATKCWLKPHPINNATANCDYFRLSLISKEFQEKNNSMVFRAHLESFNKS